MGTDRPNLIFMHVVSRRFNDGSEYRIVEYSANGRVKAYGQTRADRSQLWGEATPLGFTA